MLSSSSRKWVRDNLASANRLIRLSIAAGDGRSHFAAHAARDALTEITTNESDDVAVRRFIAYSAFAFGCALGFLVGIICRVRGWL